MAVGVWNRLDQTARNMLPSGITVLLLLVGMAPVPLAGWSQVSPPYMLVSIFYWTVHRPDLLRPSLVFLIGVLADLLGGTPLGLTPLALMLSYWLLLTQRRFFLGTSFAMLWLGFALVAAGYLLVQWLTFCVIQASLVEPKPVLVQALLTMALFPPLAALMQKLHRSYLS